MAIPPSEAADLPRPCHVRRSASTSSTRPCQQARNQTTYWSQRSTAVAHAPPTPPRTRSTKRVRNPRSAQSPRSASAARSSCKVAPSATKALRERPVEIVTACCAPRRPPSARRPCCWPCWPRRSAAACAVTTGSAAGSGHGRGLFGFSRPRRGRRVRGRCWLSSSGLTPRRLVRPSARTRRPRRAAVAGTTPAAPVARILPEHLPWSVTRQATLSSLFSRVVQRPLPRWRARCLQADRHRPRRPPSRGSGSRCTGSRRRPRAAWASRCNARSSPTSMGQGADVLQRQGQTRQFQGKGGVAGEQAQAGTGGLGDHSSGGGAVTVVVEAQQGPLGGKSPADKAGQCPTGSLGVTLPPGRCRVRGSRVMGQGVPQSGQGKLLAQRLGLLFQESGHGLLRLRPVRWRRPGSDLFHGLEIGVESGSVVAEGATCDDFCPQPWARSRISWRSLGGISRRAMVRTTLYLRPKGKSNSSALYRTHDSALQSCGWPHPRKKPRKGLDEGG